MMAGIVFRLWAMGLWAGVLICIILAVRFCLKKYPKIYSYWLWAFVGIRLLCPVWIESPFSLLPDLSLPGYQKTVQETPAANQAVPNAQPPEDAGSAGTSEVPVQKAQPRESITSEKQSQKQPDGSTGIRKEKQGLAAAFMNRLKSAERFATRSYKLPAVLYIIVSACFFAFYMLQYLWMKHKMSAAVWERDNIWLNGEIRSPFVMGVAAPKIYLPYDGVFQLPNKEKEYILEHERTHIRHHDPAIRLIGILCICLHWWNPLVWLAVSKMNEDMEMFCDETVLRAASAKERKEYANTLLSFAVKESGFGALLAFGESNTEKRIKNILYKRQKSRLIRSLTVLLAIFFMAALMTVPEDAGNSHAKIWAEPQDASDADAGNTEGSRTETWTEPQDASDADAGNTESSQTTPFAYREDAGYMDERRDWREYTGYMDECRDWSVYTAFAGQDYDGDGQTDRVFRTYRENSEYCHYRIEFGNQKTLDFDEDVYINGWPTIKAADINGDGIPEIIFSLQYVTSTDMRGFSGLAVFEKQGDAYVQAALPFECEEGYSQGVPMHCQKKREQMITVSLDGMDYTVDVPIDNVLWEEFDYKNYFADSSGASGVWDTFLVEDGQSTKLACKVHLFDKWSDYGLILILGYENQRYIIKEAMPARNEFSDELPDTRRTWDLKDYRLCTKEIKLADGSPAAVELWLSEGEYITGEDVQPGAGVYEENYQGEYILMTRDAKGNVLDRYHLSRQGEGSPEQMVFGARANFSGSFPIMDADYNGDGCPDFTIGTELSSSMNFFIVYTVREDGKIERLCEEGIPAAEKTYSILFEQEEGSSALISYEYDNWIGESRKLVYEWNQELGTYRRSYKRQETP